MSIVENRKASHDYFLEERFEAGLVLLGWEVKAIRAGRAQLKESYVIVRDGALWLKLLLKAEEISKLIGKVEQRGYALVPINLHYKNGRVKLDFGLGRGKKNYDEKERLMKHNTRNRVRS